MDDKKLDRVVAEARRARDERERGYREQALKILPAICARCGREFEGKRLRELTVHHRDGNHDHNPPDGSNWELLCLYCHENEHARVIDEQARGTRPAGEGAVPTAMHKPFADLEKLLKGGSRGK